MMHYILYSTVVVRDEWVYRCGFRADGADEAAASRSLENMQMWRKQCELLLDCGRTILRIIIILYRVCAEAFSRRRMSNSKPYYIILYYYYNDMAAERRMGGMTSLSCNTSINTLRYNNNIYIPSSPTTAVLYNA